MNNMRKRMRNLLSVAAIIIAIILIFMVTNFVKKTETKAKAQKENIMKIMAETKNITTEPEENNYEKRAKATKQFKINTAKALKKEIVETEPEPEANAEPEMEEAEMTEDQEGEYLGEFKITAYCPCYECSEGYGSQTAIGTYAQEGYTIAVDPDIIPLGSKIRFNGNEYMAEDVGGDVQGSTIDIYMESHEETMEWGVQYMDVWLVS